MVLIALYASVYDETSHCTPPEYPHASPVQSDFGQESPRLPVWNLDTVLILQHVVEDCATFLLRRWFPELILGVIGSIDCRPRYASP
jgi:hypothetical protein